LFCLKEFIINRKKRNFFHLALKILDSKLSLEYQLYHYSSFEKMKSILFDKEQQQQIDSIPNLEIEKHINQIITINNKYVEK